MKSKKKNTFISIILFFVYSIIYIVDFFTTKSIQLVPTLMCFGSLLLYFIVLRRIESIYYYGIVLFTGFAICLGQMLHLYRIIPIYDLLLHFSSGILLVFLAHYIYSLILAHIKSEDVPLIISVLFCFLFSVAGAAVWEIWEYSGDVLFGLSSQGSLDDTMTDIIAGFVGAIIGSPILYYLLKKRMKQK